MWVIKWILGALLVILIIGFAMSNTQESVTVSFLQWQTRVLPLWVVMYLSFAGGIVFWLVISIFQIVSLKNENRRCRKELRRYRQELDRLRNISVEESIPPAEQEPQPEREKAEGEEKNEPVEE